MENLNEKLIVTESPHIRSGNTTSGIMLDVIIALMPALIAGVVIFGYRAATLAVVCVSASVFFEWLWCKIVKKPSSIGDYSAAVTGLLLAMNLPVTMPFWMAIIGAFFAIVIVKQFFGGIGHNFMNPALAARAFLLTSWAQAMTTWVAPFSKVGADAVTQATPLAQLAQSVDAVSTATSVSAETVQLPSYLDLFFGTTGGCIGETCAFALLIGAIYLLAKKVISIKIPATYIITVAALTFVFGGKDGLFTGDALYHILSGGLMLGAFFMATDYVTTPYTPKGQIVFGIGCGVLTAVIRLWGGYPEGVSYSILLMNVASPLIDRYTAPKRFGAFKEMKEGGKNA
ncbi:MAG: RnfABCDGE type electron transport complex subunit D [Ruminococcaceae bacterium]|nr:RnfABCDGE type electron transport complex subunit D [Oscillospiraceae bacterium]